MKTVHFFALLIQATFSTLVHAQPSIEWQKCLGGSQSEFIISAQQSLDAGFILLGATMSGDGDVVGNHGSWDAWVVKLNSERELVWQRCIGGSGDDFLTTIIATDDGGYVLAGNTNSNDGDVSGSHGETDLWAVKLNAGGDVEWQNCLGGTYSEGGGAIQKADDGGYYLVGSTGSTDGDVSGNHGSYDLWLVKLDAFGEYVGQQCFGGSGFETGTSIEPTADGGFIIGGSAGSEDGDVVGFHGGVDFWLIKTDGAGVLEWKACLGGQGADFLSGAEQTSDGGYVMEGWVDSNDGNVAGNHGYEDMWVAKVNGSGGLSWQTCLGGDLMERGLDLEAQSDGSFLITGFAESTDGDVVGNHGSWDAWLVSLGGDGSFQWQKSIGGSSFETSNSITRTSDGGYLVAGDAVSTDGDVLCNTPSNSAWLVKLAAPESIEDLLAVAFDIAPNPASTFVRVVANTESGLTNATATVLTAMQQEVVRQPLKSGIAEFDVSQFAPGLYTIRLRSETGVTSTKRLMVE